MLVAERTLLRNAARRFHGDALLWVGSAPQMLDTTAQCMVRTRVFAAGRPMAGLDSASHRDVAVVSVGAGALPFAAGAFDGVLLHHALEAAPDPRTALREAARVLRVGGLLVVVGFNPISSWLLAKPRPAFRALKPVSVPRLRDWLALLGLETDTPLYMSIAKAWALAGSRQGSTPWWRKLPTGGVYLLSANKVAPRVVAPPLVRQAVGEFAGAAPHPVARVRPAA